jgi:hypothetical protein
MSTKSVITIAATVVLSAGSVYAQDPATPPAQPPTVNQRLENQKDRIQAGAPRQGNPRAGGEGPPGRA